ncbi:MAG TPA: dipeptidase [Chitinophagaceae bacterium]|nr:dipeptidase [Chitinophagaceae bacterium]
MYSRYILFAFALLMTTNIFSQKYKKIHNKAVLVDTHNDFPSASIEKKVSLDADLLGKTHSDLARLRAGGVDVQIFSIFCGPEQQQPYAFANREIDSVYEWARRAPIRMTIVKTPAELKQAIKDKRLAAMMGVEGGHMIEDKIENLDALYVRGVRYMTLTWNNSTSWATSAADETTKGDSLTHKGLTDFGKKVVERMNELGMLIDVSHNGEQTFWDVIKLTKKPIIASHSCVWTFCHHRRNLKDDQIKAIAKNGGVIHLNFYAGFLDSTYEKKAARLLAKHKPEIDSLVAHGAQPDYAGIMTMEKYKDETNAIRPPLSLLIDHLDYIVRLVGVDFVGLGSDFDGIEAGPKELNGVQDFPLITKALLERGYSKKDIRKILGENFLRVFKANQLGLN